METPNRSIQRGPNGVGHFLIIGTACVGHLLITAHQCNCFCAELNVAKVFLSNVEFSAETFTLMSNDEEMPDADRSDDEERPDAVGSSLDRPAGGVPYPGSSALPNVLRAQSFPSRGSNEPDVHLQSKPMPKSKAKMRASTW